MVLIWLLLGTAGDVGFLVSAMALLVLPDLERGVATAASVVRGVPARAPIPPDVGRWTLTLVVSLVVIALACVQLWRGSTRERRASRERPRDWPFEDDDLMKAA